MKAKLTVIFLLSFFLFGYVVTSQAEMRAGKKEIRVAQKPIDLSKSDSCPDITGIFLCKQNTYRTDTLYHFSRVLTDQIWTYEMRTFSNETGAELSVFLFRADGKHQTVIDQITGQRLEMLASCQNQTLEVRGEFRSPAGMTIRFSEDLSLDTNKNLSNISLDIHGNVVTEICERQ